MTMQIFNYKTDRRTVIYSILTIVIFIASAAAIFLFYKGGFFSAWFISLVAAITALMILSIPRRIEITDDELSIFCISDVTIIDIKEIVAVRKLSRRELRPLFPIFGAVGFFGNYGKFIDFKEFEVVTLYTSEWDNLVEITDIYDDRIIISCRERDAFIEAINSAIKKIEEQSLQAEASSEDM